MKPKRESLPTDIHKWNWTYRAIFPDGTKITFKGSTIAPNEEWGATASDQVEAMMRVKYPDAKWMHGRDIEGIGEHENSTFGPTVQRGKFLRLGPDPQNNDSTL